MVLSSSEYAEYVDRGCPMVLGGPLGHVMAAKAVALAEASQPEFASYAQAIVDNAQRAVPAGPWTGWPARTGWRSLDDHFGPALPGVCPPYACGGVGCRSSAELPQ
jgi:hypothetical protein